jgi:hypothetical protein
MILRRHQRMRADVPPAMPAVAFEDHAAEIAAKEARIADLEAQLASKGEGEDHAAAPAAVADEDDKGGKPGKKASK